MIVTVAVAALILNIPNALLATANLAERLQLKQKGPVEAKLQFDDI